MNYENKDPLSIYRNKEGKGPGPALMGADTLIGNDVYNSQEEDLGDIREIMIEMSTGKISYAVLSYGGFLGIADKLFAVPWESLTLDIENKRFILNVEKSRLENAPGFDKDDWPDMADHQWQEKIRSFYTTNSNY